MATTEERLRILKMIQEGKISAEEGANLLKALAAAKKTSRSPAGTSSARWFRVRVTDTETGKAKVSVSIPMGLVNVGIKMGARFIPDSANIDLEALSAQLQSGVQGKIIDVIDEEEGEHVEVFIE